MSTNDPAPKPGSQKEAELFQAAMELPEAQRAPFLDGACLGDAAMRSHLDALLQAHDTRDSFLEPAPRELEDDMGKTLKVDQVDYNSDEAVGQTLGRYKLLEKIGEGGCGVVYVAEQTKPVRRRVALKVIKLGMDTKSVVARFEAERQALAMMDHPNIAKVLDAGTTGDAHSQISTGQPTIPAGRPYFVMELVRGIKITDYCDQAQLSTKDRLDLFIKVCHALQHAHQKGIIHRDIKPSNILVTLHDGMPVPKVIDFGIAKATEGRLTDATVYTQLHQFIGTPAYMSPEQAEMSGLDIDTRCDIYSLGVLLYELLAGSTPFDAQELMALGIDAMRKTIREKEPPRPSTRLATLQGEALTTAAKRRSADTRKMLHQLKGDLDWIVMKCLEKDRSRRYDTANGLASDLNRYLNNEPVIARPASTAYRFQMAFRRNKLVFVAGTAVVAALVAGIGISTWQATKARNAMDSAVAASEEAATQRSAAQEALAQAEEERLRADQKAREARLNLYAADMKLAQLSLAENDLGRTVDFLQKHKPGPGQDYQGFEWRYLWQQARGEEIASLTVSNSRISAVDFSPNGQWLAVGGSRGARIIEVATWQENRTLAETNILKAIQFSPDGESLLTASMKAVRVWDTLTWQEKQTLEGASGLAGFSPDGLTLVTLGLSGLQIWDAHSLRLLHRVPGLKPHLQWGIHGNLAFSRDGRSMAALVEDTAAATNRVSIRIWDVASLRERGPAATPRRLHFPEVASVAALALNEDGGQLAITTVLGQLIVWDTSTGTRLASHRELAKRTYELKYRVGDGALMGGSSDHTVRTWRLEGTNLVETSLRKGHFGVVAALAESPDGAYLATGGGAGAVKLWDGSNTQRDTLLNVDAKDVVKDHLNLLDFLSDHRTLLAVSSSNRLNFWDIETGQQRRTFSNVVWHGAARVSPDQHWIAIGRTNGHVDLLDVSSKAIVTTLRGHTSEVRRIYFTPDNRRMLTASVHQGSASGELFADDSWVRLWEVPSGRLLRETNFQNTIKSIAMSPDGETFAVHIKDGPVEVRRTSDFASVFQLPTHEANQSKLAFSPDGGLLAVSYGAEINLWDVPSRELRFVHRTPNYMNWLTFAPDGQTLASASHDRTVKLWNVETMQEMLTLQLPGGCFQAEFSDDGRTLAVGTYLIEGTNRTLNVHLIRAPSLAEIADIEMKDEPGYR